ncbi:MAG: hypothetical protein JJ858_18900 [Rhizobiaceae bacterium]|nr:hypothetical protein [Rhizobiaceae bacterium]
MSDSTQEMIEKPNSAQSPLDEFIRSFVRIILSIVGLKLSPHYRNSLGIRVVILGIVSILPVALTAYVLIKVYLH